MKLIVLKPDGVSSNKVWVFDSIEKILHHLHTMDPLAIYKQSEKYPDLITGQYKDAKPFYAYNIEYVYLNNQKEQ